MFKLNRASDGIKKAAALHGIKEGYFQPVFDSSDNELTQVAKVYNEDGSEEILLLRGVIENCEQYSWNEIDEMS